MANVRRTTWTGIALLGALALSCAAAEDSKPAPATLLPPPAAGRMVVADAKSLVFDAREREMTLSDLDPEAGRLVAEINRSPGTWQSYLLYTQEDLPEVLFHPGFSIVLDRPDKKKTPAERKPPADLHAGETPAPPAGR